MAPFLIHQCIESVAAKDPDRLAATFLGDRLSYGELDAAANRLANALLEAGVERHDRVGILMDKSMQVPVSLHGIMKAGAAYVPIDPAAPPGRIARILGDCGIRHLVTAPSRKRTLRALAGLETPLTCLFGVDDSLGLPWRCVAAETLAESDADEAPVRTIVEDDLAYIIYTSGSTGTPKGIMHTHRSGLAFAGWAVSEYGLQVTDRLSNHAPLHFDLSIFDYFAAALAGACTVIIPEEHTKLPASYARLLAEQKVSVLFTVPFALVGLVTRGALGEHDLSALRWAIFGGDPFPPAHLRSLMNALPHVRFDNMYGPAEVNGVTHYTVPADMDGIAPVPIGPIARSAEALIVDANDRPVAAGESGQLLVRTPTMMQGYWGRDDLNARAFYRRTYGPGLTAVYYRTGDIVADCGGGVLRFIGRQDRQVKVRGYRVELDEIEAVLAGHAAVEEAAAYTVPAADESLGIEAQVTLEAGKSATPDELERFARKGLPAYAVPGKLLIAEHFPRTTTGKIDRRALRDDALGGARQDAAAG